MNRSPRLCPPAWRIACPTAAADATDAGPSGGEVVRFGDRAALAQDGSDGLDRGLAVVEGVEQPPDSDGEFSQSRRCTRGA
ncbi:MAG: hypothetical protein ACRDQF_18735, partial [Thermocrispum sp.]